MDYGAQFGGGWGVEYLVEGAIMHNGRMILSIEEACGIMPLREYKYEAVR